MSAACHDDRRRALERGPDAAAPPPASAAEPALVALVGRPNAGKSSLYNQLTGGDAHVGNYPGITVDILEAEANLPSGRVVTVADLPGLYSVEAAVDPATDEGVARSFLEAVRATGRRLVAVQVIDPTRLALGLRLTRELAGSKMPLVLVLTHADVLRREGRAVDVEGLAQATGATVLLVDGRRPQARGAVLQAIDDCLRGRGEGPAATFDPQRVASAVTSDVGTDVERRRRRFTERCDRVLMSGALGPILFLLVMALVFAAVFLVADPASTAMDSLLGLTRRQIVRAFGDGLATSFVTDGVLGGAGTVLAFMPQIVILTVALELLEASGYLARGAYLVDRFFRGVGLSGRSFLPLLMGHACAVPAIQATRIVRDPRERLTTILVLPLMTCSARLPTYGLVIATFFASRSALFKSALFVGLYFTGIAAGLAAACVLRRTATRGRGLPLVLEMPAYRVPQAAVVARKAARAAKRFVRDVGTVILAVSAALWVLVTIPMPSSTRPPGIESSIAATIGRSAEPLTEAAGFDWRINVGLIGSFGAREVMIGTMGVIFGVEDTGTDAAPLTERLRDAKKPDGTPLYSTRTGLALLAFFVLACQCMSTVAAIRRETASWRWPAFVLAYTYALGYAAAVFVYQVSGFFGVG